MQLLTVEALTVGCQKMHTGKLFVQVLYGPPFGMEFENEREVGT